MSESNTDCGSQRSENTSTDVASTSSAKPESCEINEEPPQKPRSHTLHSITKSPPKRKNEGALHKCSHPRVVEYENWRNCHICGAFLTKVKYDCQIRRALAVCGNHLSPMEMYRKMLQDEKILLYRQHNPDNAFIKYREVLVDWIYELGDKLKQSTLIIHIAIAYLDIAMYKHTFHKKQLQLVALTSLLIASKYDELDDKIPLIRDFQRATKSYYTESAIKQCELFLLQLFDWKLVIITPIHFTASLLGMGVVFQDDRIEGKSSGERKFQSIDMRAVKCVKRYVEFFADLCLQDYSLYQWDSSVVGMACVVAARRANRVNPLWSRHFEELSGFTFQEVKPCYERVYDFYKRAFHGKSNTDKESSRVKSQAAPYKGSQPLSSQNANTRGQHSHKPSTANFLTATCNLTPQATHPASASTTPRGMTSKPSSTLISNVLETNQNIVNGQKLPEVMKSQQSSRNGKRNLPNTTSMNSSATSQAQQQQFPVNSRLNRSIKSPNTNTLNTHKSVAGNLTAKAAVKNAGAAASSRFMNSSFTNNSVYSHNSLVNAQQALVTPTNVMGRDGASTSLSSHMESKSSALTQRIKSTANKLNQRKPGASVRSQSQANPHRQFQYNQLNQSSFNHNNGATAANALNTSISNHSRFVTSRDYSSSQNRQQKPPPANTYKNPMPPPLQGLNKKSKSLECLGGTYYFRKNYLLPIQTTTHAQLNASGVHTPMVLTAQELPAHNKPKQVAVESYSSSHSNNPSTQMGQNGNMSLLTSQTAGIGRSAKCRASGQQMRVAKFSKGPNRSFVDYYCSSTTTSSSSSSLPGQQGVAINSMIINELGNMSSFMPAAADEAMPLSAKEGRTGELRTGAVSPTNAQLLQSFPMPSSSLDHKNMGRFRSFSSYDEQIMEVLTQDGRRCARDRIPSGGSNESGTGNVTARSVGSGANQPNGTVRKPNELAGRLNKENQYAVILQEKHSSRAQRDRFFGTLKGKKPVGLKTKELPQQQPTRNMSKRSVVAASAAIVTSKQALR